MAKKQVQVEDDIIDLTELIESGNSGDRRAANAYAKAASLQNVPDDDFEAVLAQETGAAKASHNVDPDEALDMSGMGGIDNLLDSLDIPSQPREDAKSAEPDEDDLDSALDDLLGNDAPGVEKPADDLDSLLSDLPSEKNTPPPPPEKKAPETRDLDSDLDDILSSFDMPDEPAPGAQKANSRAEPDKSGELTADLDDILNEVPPPPPPKPVIEEEPVAAPPPAREQAAPTLTEAVPELDQELFSEPEIAQKPERIEKEDTIEPAKRQLEDENAPSRMPAIGAENAPAQLQAAPATIWSPEAVAGICRNLAVSQDGATQQALQGFARELGEQSAHVEDLVSQIEQLAKRVMACESRLSAARVKIANLEKALESTAALDDLLREGTPLHAGFMALISAAVSNVLQKFSPDAPEPDPELLNRIDTLTVRLAETSERVSAIEKRIDSRETGPETEGIDDMGKLINGLENTDARISALEKRLGELSNEMGAKLEKAAAATAARVLQEEITRLIQGGNGI